MATLRAINTAQVFLVAEVHRQGWTPHIFASREEFISWRQRNPSLIVVDRRSARGRMYAAVDHRDDWLFEDLP